MQETLKRAEEMMAKDTDIAIKGPLPLRSEGATGHTRWTRGVVRRIVGIEDVEGSVDHVDLRCEFHRATWTPKPGKAWRIPPEWGSCWLHVFGEPRTKFNLSEYADSVADKQAKAALSQ